MKERIKDIISYSDMIGSLVKKDLRGKYKGSVLGFYGRLSIRFVRL